MRVKISLFKKIDQIWSNAKIQKQRASESADIFI